jgi:hypothetical protein
MKAGITILNVLLEAERFVLDFFSFSPSLEKLNCGKAVTIIFRKCVLAAFENAIHLAENVMNILIFILVQVEIK